MFKFSKILFPCGIIQQSEKAPIRHNQLGGIIMMHHLILLFILLLSSGCAKDNIYNSDFDPNKNSLTQISLPVMIISDN